MADRAQGAEGATRDGRGCVAGARDALSRAQPHSNAREPPLLTSRGTLPARSAAPQHPFSITPDNTCNMELQRGFARSRHAPPWVRFGLIHRDIQRDTAKPGQIGGGGGQP